MADRFRLVTIGPDGRARLELELNEEPPGIFRERDTFTFTPAPRRERTVVGEGRYQGGRVQATAHDNATAAVTLNVAGAGDELAAAQRAERLLERADRIAGAGDLFIEWRPEGLPRSVYMPVRGPATVRPTYRVRAFQGAAFLPVEVSWPVAPLLEGLPMDVDERWVPPSDKVDGIINALPNPGFEAGVLAADGWAIYANGTTATVAEETAIVRSGGVSAKFTATTAGGQIGPVTSDMPVKCKPGDVVVVAGYSRAGATPRQTWNIIGWYTAAGAFLSSVGGPQVANVVGAWTRTTPLSAVAPADAAQCNVYTVASLPALNEVHYFDDIMAVVNPPGGTMPAYGDGDSDSYRWEGIPHESRSIELAEGKLAEYVAESATEPHVVDREGLHVGGPGAQSSNNARLWNSRYRWADGEVITTGRVDAQGGGGDSNYLITAGLAWDTDENRGFWVTVSGATITLYYYNPTAGNLALASAGGAPFPLVLGRTYSLLIRKAGNRLEGELWTGEPVRGGTPTAAVAFDLTESTTPKASDMGEGRTGYPLVRCWGNSTPTVARATIQRFRALPYSYPGKAATPALITLPDIPGNAPAKAAVDLSTGGTNAVLSALLGWRRLKRHSLPVNGDLGVDLDGWTNTGTHVSAGATVARVATGGPDDSAYAQATASALANTGMVYTLYGRLRAGRRVTVEAWVNEVSGAWDFLLAGDGASLPGDPAALAGAAGVWTRQQWSFYVPTARDKVELEFRQAAAVAGSVLRVAALRLWEGGPEDDPAGYSQTAGRGAQPPFGLMHAQNDDPSARTGFVVTAVAGAITGSRLRLTPPTLAGTADYLLDADLLGGDDDADHEEVDVEVYAAGSIGAGLKSPRIALATLSADVSGQVLSYTREDGAVGKALTLPTSGQRDRAWRLGTITLPRDPGFLGRTILRLSAVLAAGSTDYLEVEYLILVPRLARAGSPTGLVSDASYPAFLPATVLTPAHFKTIRPDLSGVITQPNRGAARDTGLAGSPLELPPGDVELVAWLQEGAPPDDPAASIAVAADPAVHVHVGVTPRYRLFAAD